jgi:hypothetical protein
VLSRSRPRFFLQAALLIGVATIAAVLHLEAWAIAVAMAAAFGGVVGTEWLVTRAAAATSPPKPAPMPAPEPDIVALQDQTRNVPAASPAGEEYAFIRHLREVADDLSDDVDGFLRKSFPNRRASE